MIFIRKFDTNTKGFSFFFFLFLVICASIAFEKVIGNIGLLYGTFEHALFLTKSVLSPFIFAFFLAFLLNPQIKYIEKMLDKFKQPNLTLKQKRFISLIMTFVMLTSIISFIISVLVPAFTASIEPIEKLVNASKSRIWIYIKDPLETFAKQNLTPEEYISNFNKIFNTNFDMSDIGASLIAIPNFFNKFIGLTFDFVLGTVVAFYILADKESMLEDFKKMIFVFFKPDKSDYLLKLGGNSVKVFQRFFVGKFIDSLIIAILFLITGAFLKLPFLALCTLIVGITNMIPYFGPFIGAVPVILLTFLNDVYGNMGFSRTLMVSIAILIIQQLDGNIIGPKILGDSTGLKPLDVVFSIIVGGAVAGPIGMLMAVPIFSIIKSIFLEFVNMKYDEKKRSA